MSSVNIINGGLDVQSIVDNLMYLEREPVRRLQSQTTTLQSKVTAFQSLNTKVSALLDKANTVLFNSSTVPFLVPGAFEDRLSESIFAMRTAVSSDEKILTATATGGAASGNYAITVSGLAAAKSTASTNFADINTTGTGTGTLVFQIGSDAPVTVTIDSTNNTLDGVRKAINSAGAGVTASIVNDGSATPYRLLITSKDTGIANAFTLTDNLTGGQALGMTQTTAAADARINVNGIDITKSSNSISDVIEGVTLNLKALTASAVNISLNPDVDGMVSALKDLISAYNDVTSYINSQFAYNATTKTAGVLSGDPTLRSTQANIQNIFTQSITNNFSAFHVISQVGFAFNNDGSITIDEAKLRDSLTKDLNGVAALLLGDGLPGVSDQVSLTDSRVTYQSSTSATQPGTYDIQVTALASQGSVTSNFALTALSQDETLTITYGGIPTTVNLLAGDSLAAVITKINNALTANGVAATATGDSSNHVMISTNNYGSAENISVVSDQSSAAGTTGFGTIPTTGTGTDIAGTISGNAAVGNGMVLTGASGRPEEGLVLSIAQTTSGSYGSVTITSGVQGQEGASVMVNLRTALKHITDPLSGPIHNATDALNKNIHDINDQIDAYNERLDVREQLLTNEYSRADQALKLLSVNQSSLNNLMSSLSSIS